MMTEEMITEGIDTDLLVEGVEELVERAKEDYRKWSEMSSRYDGDSESRRTIRDDMIAEYDGVVSVIDFKTSNSEKKEEWIENYFIQGTAYAKMFTERTGIPCSQLVIFIVPDSGTPQIFTKSVDDYTPQLITAIEDFSNYQKKT